MAELLCSRYIPYEQIVIRNKGKTINDFEKEGYEVGFVLNTEFKVLIKPPRLEMVFQGNNEDYVFDMLKEAKDFFKKGEISSREARKFAVLIARGEIKVTILPDGSYTLK